MKNIIKKHWALILSLVYLIWPLDIIPDFFPVPAVGAIDDAIILALAIIREVIVYYRKPKITKLPSPSRPK